MSNIFGSPHMAPHIRMPWSRAKSDVRSLRGRLGFEDSDKLRFFGFELNLENGVIYDTVLNRYVVGDEAEEIYFILSVYSKTRNDVGETGRLIPLSKLLLCQGDKCPRLANIRMLGNVINGDPQRLFIATNPFNPQVISFADATVKIYALPRVPIYIAVWRGEALLPPSTVILFDESAPNYLGSDRDVVCECVTALADILATRLIDYYEIVTVKRL